MQPKIAFRTAIFLLLMGAVAIAQDHTAAVLLLPFQGETQEAVDLGIGVHNLLENMLLQHGGLDETLALNNYPSLFPKYAELETYRLGRGEAKDLNSLRQRWVVTGRVESGKVALVVLNRQTGAREAATVAMDAPGWIEFRKGFIAVLERAGVPWTAERSAAMFWREDLPETAMRQMGAGLRNYVEVMIYKPEGRSHERTAMEAAVAAGPKSYLAVNNLAWVAFQQGDRDRAAGRFTQALKRHGEGIDAWDGMREVAIGKVDVAAVKVAVERKAKARQLRKPSAAEWPGLAVRWEQAGDAADAQNKEPFYRAGLSMARAAGDRQKEGTLLLKLGSSFRARQVYGEALPLLEQALPLFGTVGDRNGEATTLKNIGRTYADIGENQKALGYFKQALPLFKAVGDRDNEATTLDNIGFVYSALGEKQKALGYLEQSLPLSRAVGNRGGEADTLDNIGTVYEDLGEHQTALGYFEQALQLKRAVGNRKGEAGVLNNMGAVYTSLGEKQKALSYFEQALQLKREVGDRNGEATTLNNIGLAYLDLGEKQKALGYFEQALPLDRAVGNRGAEATTLNNIGGVYLELGRKEKALGYLVQSLPLYRAVGDRDGEATTLNNIGTIYDDLGEKQKALGYYENALPLLRAVGNRKGEAGTLNNIGFIFSDLGEKQKALGYYEQALPFFRAVGDRGGEGTTLNNIGAVYSSLGEKQKALGYYEQSLPLHRAVGNRGGEASALYNTAVIHKQLHPPLSAWLGKLAASIEHSLRGDVRGLSVEQRQSVDQQMKPTFLFSAEVLLSLDRLREGQQVIDLLKEGESFQYGRSDSQAFLDRQLTFTPIEQAATAEYTKLSGKVERLGTERQPLAQRLGLSASEAERLKLLSQQLDEASAAFSAFLKEMKMKFDEPAAPGEKVGAVMEAERLISTLRQLGPGAVAVYALPFNKRYAALLVTPAGHEVFFQDLEAATLKNLSNDFRMALTNLGANPLPAAQELYRKVIPEALAKRLKEVGAKTILWSLEGSLRSVPMPALHDGTQYLAQSFGHSLLTPGSEGQLLASVPHQWTGVGFGASKGGKDYSPLPGVDKELQGIFGTDQTAPKLVAGRILVDSRFTREALLKHECACNVVHIASHFRAKGGAKENSKLLLGDGSEISLAELEASGKLFSGVNLLVLSACETGTIDVSSDGRELDSLGSTALRLGAQAVLASLWSVNDNSTALFMEHFYRVRNQTSGMTKAEAIQATQLAMIEGKIKGSGCAGRFPGGTTTLSQSAYRCEEERPYSHPFYWAPFVLMGNWN